MQSLLTSYVKNPNQNFVKHETGNKKEQPQFEVSEQRGELGSQYSIFNIVWPQWENKLCKPLTIGILYCKLYKSCFAAASLEFHKC